VIKVVKEEEKVIVVLIQILIQDQEDLVLGIQIHLVLIQEVILLLHQIHQNLQGLLLIEEIGRLNREEEIRIKIIIVVRNSNNRVPQDSSLLLNRFNNNSSN
jgi:hypothetical protein